MIARLQHKAATLRLLLVGVAALSTSAGAQMAFLPNCNFQEASLAPCMIGAGGGGNISGACCSSLNRALDAGHRCVCSLLLANPVFASLVTNLLPLPLLLPLPGCFLYAPSLAACQATTMLQQTIAPPTADPPTTQAAAVTPSPDKKSAGPGKADGGRSTGGDGTGEAAPSPRAGQTVSRSNACGRRPGSAGQGTAYALTFLTAVAVSWINSITVS